MLCTVFYVIKTWRNCITRKQTCKNNPKDNLYRITDQLKLHYLPPALTQSSLALPFHFPKTLCWGASKEYVEREGMRRGMQMRSRPERHLTFVSLPPSALLLPSPRLPHILLPPTPPPPPLIPPPVVSAPPLLPTPSSCFFSPQQRIWMR